MKKKDTGDREAIQARESSSEPVYETDLELAQYFSTFPAHAGVLIHVVGPEDDARIIVTPQPVFAKRHRDHVSWAAGANCGEWEVAFKDRSPLDPPGPYSSSGPTGGAAVGDLGLYRYGVRAVDVRTGDWVEYDPEVIIIPGV